MKKIIDGIVAQIKHTHEISSSLVEFVKENPRLQDGDVVVGTCTHYCRKFIAVVLVDNPNDVIAMRTYLSNASDTTGIRLLNSNQARALCTVLDDPHWKKKLLRDPRYPDGLSFDIQFLSVDAPKLSRTKR